MDSYLKAILESPELYRSGKKPLSLSTTTVKCVGHIDVSVVFYHEPFCFQRIRAGERRGGMLQYMDLTKEKRLTPLESAALLAGIMLDTRNFSLPHGRVDTFEAAAYLSAWARRRRQ